MHGSPCCCTTDGVKPEQQSDRISATQEVKKIQFSSIIAHKNIDVSSCNTSKSPKTTRNYQTAKPEQLRGRRVWNHHHTIKLLRKIEGNRMIHARTHFIDVTSFSQAFDNDIIYIYIALFTPAVSSGTSFNVVTTNNGWHILTLSVRSLVCVLQTRLQTVQTVRTTNMNDCAGCRHLK